MPRIIDPNGYMTIPDNPISKVGVFPYMGSEINAPEPNRIYQVYRPEEELSSPATIESFKLLPFINDHVMLGALGIPVEQKGMQGVLGENIYYDAPYLRGPLRIHTSAAQALVNNGKIDLSPGYTSRYEFTPGVFNGQAYDAIQRDIRGNHLALVDEGRTGPDVSVQDQTVSGHFTITLDSAEVLAMPSTLEELLALIKQAVAEIMQASQAAGVDADPAAPDPEKQPAGDVDPAAQGDVAAAAAEVVEAAEELAATVAGTPQAAAMDGLLTGIKGIATVLAAQQATINTLVANTDQATVAGNIADAAAYYARVTPLVGNFDQSPLSRTKQGIAQYVCDKLSLGAPKGHEVATLDGYLAGLAKAPKAVTTTDSNTKAADAVSRLDQAWEGK
jgi:hypothetical protein